MALWILAEKNHFMGAKLCPKIILEGTRLTFKTEIAFVLNEHPRQASRQSGNLRLV